MVLLTGEQPGSERGDRGPVSVDPSDSSGVGGSLSRSAGLHRRSGPQPAGRWLADAFSLPLVGSVGYDTPGSFGSWCADIGLPCITAEFPPVSADEATERYLPAMTDLLRWQA